MNPDILISLSVIVVFGYTVWVLITIKARLANLEAWQQDVLSRATVPPLPLSKAGHDMRMAAPLPQSDGYGATEKLTPRVFTRHHRQERG